MRDRAVGAEISIGSDVVLIALGQLIVVSRKRATKPREVEVVSAKAAEVRLAGLSMRGLL
jgi:hypothetical protein